MAPKAKKEAPAPPKAEAKAKALKAKKAVLKGIHSHKKKEDPHVTYIPTTQDTASAEAAQISSKERPQEKQVSTVLSHEKMLGNLEIYQTYSMISQIHVGT